MSAGAPNGTAGAPNGTADAQSGTAGALNRRFVLARRVTGTPCVDDFRLETQPLGQPADGEILVRNTFISVDPGTRGRMGDATSYAEPLAIGEVIQAATVGIVTASRHAKFAAGDRVAAAFGWQEWGLSDGRGVRRIPDNGLPASTAIGLLGIPGLTAYFGMLQTGELKAGDRVLVTSASGAVGSAAAQIAMIRGAGKVVGVAGGAAKCRWLVDDAGLAGAIDHRATPDLARAVAEAFPDGVDLLFDNVGNAMIDQVLPLMRTGGRIVVCGQTADYNLPPDQVPGLRNTRAFIVQRLTMRGLVAFDHFREFPAAWADLTEWARAGRLKYREELVDGFESLPQAFIGLFSGDNFGRRLVRLE